VNDSHVLTPFQGNSFCLKKIYNHYLFSKRGDILLALLVTLLPEMGDTYGSYCYFKWVIRLIDFWNVLYLFTKSVEKIELVQEHRFLSSQVAEPSTSHVSFQSIY
jgi:hypothetical protein